MTECTEPSWLTCCLKLDLTQPLDTQGHFDAIVHKVTDILAKADSGNVTAQQYIQNIQVIYCISYLYMYACIFCASVLGIHPSYDLSRRKKMKKRGGGGDY